MNIITIVPIFMKYQNIEICYVIKSHEIEAISKNFLALDQFLMGDILGQ